MPINEHDIALAMVGVEQEERGQRLRELIDGAPRWHITPVGHANVVDTERDDAPAERYNVPAEPGWEEEVVPEAAYDHEPVPATLSPIWAWYAKTQHAPYWCEAAQRYEFPHLEQMLGHWVGGKFVPRSEHG